MLSASSALVCRVWLVWPAYSGRLLWWQAGVLFQVVPWLLTPSDGTHWQVAVLSQAGFSPGFPVQTALQLGIFTSPSESSSQADSSFSCLQAILRIACKKTLFGPYGREGALPWQLPLLARVVVVATLHCRVLVCMTSSGSPVHSNGLGLGRQATPLGRYNECLNKGDGAHPPCCLLTVQCFPWGRVNTVPM